MTDDPNCGATLDEWKAWYHLAPRDLLPTICASGVRMVAGKSGAQPNTKTPSYLRSDGRGSGIVGWPKLLSTQQEVIAWSEQPVHGICLVNRYLRSVDVDLEDEGVKALIEEHLPGMPCRYREDSGRVAYLYRMYSDDYTRKKVAHLSGGEVEFLFDRQQLMVAGTHPDGARYQWRGLEDGIPDFTFDQIQALYRALTIQFSDDPQDWDRSGEYDIGDRALSQVDPDDPLVKYLYENDWVLSVEPDGKMLVRSPWAHLHTQDTGPSSTAFYPAGVGGRAEPGYSPLHASEEGKTIEDFLQAIGYRQSEVQSEFGITTLDTPTERPVFTYQGKSMNVSPVLPNVIKMLRWEGCGYHVAWDDFRAAIVFTLGGGPWEEFEDHTYIQIRNTLILDHRFAETLPAQPVRDAVHLVSRENQFDSAYDWLHGQIWDGVERIDTFCETVLRLRPSEYHTAVSRYIWTALAGRVVEPGLKVDMVPILSGKQGLRKSTFVERLAPTPDQFTAVSLESRDADLSRQMRGKLVVEWPELRGMRSRDAAAVKGWITQRMDEWIPKYQEFSHLHPRRFLLVGTTNDRRFLNDPTGSRRYLPLFLRHPVDTDALSSMLRQLWAEALVLFKAEGLLWKDAERLAHVAIDHATERHPWSDVISGWLEGQDWQDDWTSAQLLENAVGLPRSQMGQHKYSTLVRVMTSMGWVQDDNGRWHQSFA